MGAKTKAVPAGEPEVAPEEKDLETQAVPNKEEPQAEYEDEVSQRREKRKDEWGTQMDRWLIRCQQKGKTVLLYLGEFDPTKDASAIKAVPKRIDQHFVQFEIEGREVWIGKRYIAGIEPDAE
jgi:hypothetical protein